MVANTKRIMVDNSEEKCGCDHGPRCLNCACGHGPTCKGCCCGHVATCKCNRCTSEQVK